MNKSDVIEIVKSELSGKIQEAEVDEDTSLLNYDGVIERDGCEVEYNARVDVVTRKVEPEMDYFRGTGITGGWEICGAKAFVDVKVCFEFEGKI